MDLTLAAATPLVLQRDVFCHARIDFPFQYLLVHA